MAGNNILVDSSFLIAALNRHDTRHGWALATAERFTLPWRTCDAVLSDVFHLIGSPRYPALITLLERKSLISAFHMGENAKAIIALMRKYANVPMSFADACLVRMTEIIPEPILLTTDSDFRIYRRFGRQTIPCMLPA